MSVLPDTSSARFLAASPVKITSRSAVCITNTRWPGVWPGARCAVMPGNTSSPSAALCKVGQMFSSRMYSSGTGVSPHGTVNDQFIGADHDPRLGKHGPVRRMIVMRMREQQVGDVGRLHAA